jgi:hypothetical protein
MSHVIEACHLRDIKIIVILCALYVGVKFGLSFHERTKAKSVEEHMPI